MLRKVNIVLSSVKKHYNEKLCARKNKNDFLFVFLFIAVNYKVELYDPRSQGFMPSSPGIGMHVEVRDPDDKTILSRVYSSEGRISFTSHTPGEHVICLYSNSTAWFSGTQLVKYKFSSTLRKKS